ncbi:unnamed protein product [Cuscuta europaea]|uniref:Tudor domain-containing protein n=1 Tax=Cuscuta europaea TaxID=41803 RepID=A0A9P0ZNT7_CUSEU|nr:unnamed protein product [Cuscuta europaea]
MASASSALTPTQIEYMENLKQLTAQLLTPPPVTDDLLCLLEKVERALLRMVSGPHKLITTEFNAIKEALGDRKFLLHPNKFIETCVTSCIVEVMRVTAPSPPYDNEKMKIVFHQIIASVESLPHVLSGYYGRCTSILARMVKIRGFVVLWDIDDWLALNIFQLPLKIIMPYHPEREKGNMEAIMVQMIEECDKITLDILFPLFECLRKQTQMDAPMSSLLAHQVLEKCAAKLNPHLLEAVKLLGMKVEGYTDQFLTLCRKLAEEEKVVEKVGALSAIEGTSEVQRPDATPRAMNIDNFNQESIGSSLKAKCSNQAEQLEDADIPDLHNHENTKDLQQVDPSGLPEKIEPTKEQDCLGINGSENWVEEPNNIYKKEHEKQLGSSSGDATSKESPLPSETEKHMSEMTERNGPSKGKQGKGLFKDDEATPSVVTKKEVHETVGEVEKAPPVQPNDLQKVGKGVALSSIEGISDAQLPDITPVAMNIGSSNQEPVGSPLKAECGDQAEQLKDADEVVSEVDLPPLPPKTETHMSEMAERNGSSNGRQGNGPCNDDEVTPGVVNTKKEVDEVVSEVQKQPVQKNDLQNANTRTKRKRKQALNKEKVKKGGAVSAKEETSDVQLLNVTPKSMIIDNINQDPIGPPLKAECGSRTEQLKGADKPAEVHENTNDLQQQVYPSRLPKKREPTKEHDRLGMSGSENYVEEPQNNNYKNKKEHEKRSEDATSKESPLPSETKKHTHRRAQPNKKKSEMTVRSGSKGARSSKGKQGKGSCKDDELEKGGAISAIEGMSEKIEPKKEQDCLGMNESEKCVKDSENNNKEHEKQSQDATSGKSPLPPKIEKHKSVMTERNGSKGARSFKGKLGKSPCKDNEATSGVVKIKEGEEEKEGGISDLEKPHAQKNELQNTSTRTKRKRKEVLNKEKDSRNHPIGKDYGEELIGAIIRVWWPVDRMFYKGTISSFDPETKKHKIKYIDNDVETLNLNLERWEMLEEASVKEEHVFDSPSLVSTAAGEKAKKGTSKKKESAASSSKGLRRK